MKKLYAIILVFCIVGISYAQDTTYFEQTKTGRNGLLILHAKKAYESLPLNEKTFAIRNQLPFWQDSNLLYIHLENRKELWTKDKNSNSFILLDTLNMDRTDMRRFRNEKPEKLIAHPWFFYWGGQGVFNEDFVNLYASTRIGFFLLLNRWDLAASCSYGFSSTENNDYTSLNLGLVSKFYFPIKKYPVSPYIGSGISYNLLGNDEYINTPTDYTTNYTETSLWDVSFMTGVSWYVGPGSLDIGIQFGTESEFMMTIGYTFSPWNSKSKKPNK